MKGTVMYICLNELVLDLVRIKLTMNEWIMSCLPFVVGFFLCLSFIESAPSRSGNSITTLPNNSTHLNKLEAHPRPKDDAESSAQQTTSTTAIHDELVKLFSPLAQDEKSVLDSTSGTIVVTRNDSNPVNTSRTRTETITLNYRSNNLAINSRDGVWAMLSLGFVVGGLILSVLYTKMWRTRHYTWIDTVDLIEPRTISLSGIIRRAKSVSSVRWYKSNRYSAIQGSEREDELIIRMSDSECLDKTPKELNT